MIQSSAHGFPWEMLPWIGSALLAAITLLILDRIASKQDGMR